MEATHSRCKICSRSVRSILLSLSSVHAMTKEVILHTRLMERPFPLSAKPVALSSSRFAFSAIDKCDVVSIPPKACRSVLCLPPSLHSLRPYFFLCGPGERLPGPTTPNSKSASLLHCTSSARFLRDVVRLGRVHFLHQISQISPPP